MAHHHDVGEYKVMAQALAASPLVLKQDKQCASRAWPMAQPDVRVVGERFMRDRAF